MNFDDIKKVIEECIKGGDEKTVIYHKLERLGLSFEEAREITNRLYDEIALLVPVQKKKMKVREIKSLNPKKEKININFENIKIGKFEQVYITPVIAIIVALVFGKLGVNIFYYTILPLLIAASVFILTNGTKSLKNQIIAVISTLIAIFGAHYSGYFNELSEIAGKNNFKLGSMLSLYNVEGFFKEVSISKIVSVDLLFIALAVLIAYEYSYGDFERLKKLLKFKKN